MVERNMVVQRWGARPKIIPPSLGQEQHRILQGLSDCSHHAQLCIVTALFGTLRLPLMLFVVDLLAAGDPVFDRLFLKSPDVP